MDYKEKLKSLCFSRSSPRRSDIADYAKTFPDLERRLVECDRQQWERERKAKYSREEDALLREGKPSREFEKIVDEEMRKLKRTL